MDTMFGFNVLSIEGFSSFSWFMEVIFLLDRTFTQQQEMACRAFQRAHLRLQTAPLDEKRSAEHVVLMVVTNLGRATALVYKYTPSTTCQSSVMVEDHK